MQKPSCLETLYFSKRVLWFWFTFTTDWLIDWLVDGLTDDFFVPLEVLCSVQKTIRSRCFLEFPSWEQYENVWINWVNPALILLANFPSVCAAFITWYFYVYSMMESELLCASTFSPTTQFITKLWTLFTVFHVLYATLSFLCCLSLNVDFILSY